MNKYLIFLTLILTPAFSVHAADTTTVKKCTNTQIKEFHVNNDGVCNTNTLEIAPNGIDFKIECNNPDNPTKKINITGFAIPTDQDTPPYFTNQSLGNRFSCLCVTLEPHYSSGVIEIYQPNDYNTAMPNYYNYLPTNCIERCTGLSTQ